MSFLQPYSAPGPMEQGLDSFGRHRVSTNHILLSGQLTHADNALIWDTQAVNSGQTAYDSNRSSIAMNVADVAGSEVIRQTKRYWLYRAGQGHLVRMTFADAFPESSSRKRAGYFDADDGLFFEVNGATDVALVYRTSVTGAPVDLRVLQADWNLDTLDGSGPSGATMDLANAQHFVVDMQWLGVGRARLGFEMAGHGLVYVHEFDLANVVVGGPYLKTASLPVRYEITRIGSGTGTFLQICAGVMREGGSEEAGIPTFIRSDVVTQLTATTTPRSAIVARLKSSHIRAFLEPTKAWVLNEGTAAQHVGWDLVVNPTLGGTPVFTSAGVAAEAASVLAQQQAYTVGTGHIIASGVSPGSGTGPADPVVATSIRSVIGCASDIAGNADTIALIVQSASGTPSIVAGLGVLELF